MCLAEKGLYYYDIKPVKIFYTNINQMEILKYFWVISVV